MVTHKTNKEGHFDTTRCAAGPTTGWCRASVRDAGPALTRGWADEPRALCPDRPWRELNLLGLFTERCHPRARLRGITARVIMPACQHAQIPLLSGGLAYYQSSTEQFGGMVHPRAIYLNRTRDISGVIYL